MSRRRRTVSYVLQWLVIIAIVAACLRIFFRPVPWPDRRPETWRSWEGFYALSYGSIMRAPTGPEVSPGLLRTHFAALRSAGYKTITPDDLSRYTDGTHALPEKALLLMFEGGRKDSILNVTPLLREFGLVAVACVNTGASESRDRFYMTASELRDLAHQPHWYMASMGHQAMTHLSQETQSQKDVHFLTGRIHKDGVPEDDTAFVKRVMQDYETSARFLKSLTGRSPALFLYPYTDRGVGGEADPLSGRVNRMAVEMLYRLALVDAYEPFNGPTRDRYALTRLRVDNRLTAAALLDRLSRSRPRLRTPDSPVTHVDWIFSGKARESAVVREESGQAPNAVQLQDGMAAWIRSSQDWTDSEISATVRFAPEAIAGLYARYTEPEQCLYLSVAATGIRLQERSKVGNHVTLLDQKTRLQPGREYELRLMVKRNRAFVFVDGRRAGHALPLMTAESAGKCGIGSNRGTSVFSRVKAWPIPVVFVIGDQYRSLPAPLRESAVAFLPSLPVTERQPLSSGGSVCVDQQQVDEMMAAASEGVEPIPLVSTLVRPGSPSTRPCSRLGDLSALRPLIKRLGLRGIGVYKPQELVERELAPVRVLQADRVREWLRSSKDTKQEIILVEGPAYDVLRAIDLLLLKIPPHRLVAGSVRRSDLPPGVGVAVHSRSSE